MIQELVIIFFYDLSRFHNYIRLEEPVRITVGGRSNLMGVGVGDVVISYMLNSKVEEATLRSTLYIPGAHFNLLSIGVLDDAGHLATFGSGECKVFSPLGQLMLSAKRLGSSTRLYNLFECASPVHAGLGSSTRLCHLFECASQFMQDCLWWPAPTSPSL